MNAVPDGWRIVTIAVPTRAFRIIIDTETEQRFRIEQLDASANFTWRPISLFHGDEPWYSYPEALQDMVQKHARFKEMVKMAQHKNRMAMIAAQDPHHV